MTTTTDVCPRCAEPLRIQYQEPYCIQCGYVDYTTGPKLVGGGSSLLSRGATYLVPYLGEYANLQGEMLRVSLHRRKPPTHYVHINAFGRPLNVVVESELLLWPDACYWCDRSMELSYQVNTKDAAKYGYSFRCAQKHRLRVMPQQAKVWGWT